MAINALFYENKVPSGTGVLEIVSENSTETGQASRLFVPLQKSDLTGTFHGPLGSLVLSQTFRFSKEVISTPIEAVYRFPLPGDAAVSEVVVKFGDEVIRTKLMERNAAEKVYDKAFDEGRKAALVTRESPDIFTLNLTGIPPDTDVTVQTTFTLLARVVPKGWEIRVPFTIGPRYTRSDEHHPGTQAQPLLNAADPGYRVSMDIWLRPAIQVTSVTPKAEIIVAGGVTRVKAKDIMPNRDLVLKWTMAKEKEMLTAWSTDDPTSGHRYLLSLINPGNDRTTAPIPREMILVVDQSGSMSGRKWDAARNSLFALLDTLKEGEYFNVCLFSDNPEWSSTTGPVSVTTASVKAAKTFVDRTKLFSGTELGVALEQATGQRKQQGIFSRHIIVITDGQVTDEARIFSLAEKERTKPGSRRVSVITIDSSPNAYLTEELARLGGGTAKFLEDNRQVQGVLEELLLCWQQPLFNDVVLASNEDLDIPGYRIALGNVGRGIDIGDIRPGMPLFLCGRVPLSEQKTEMILLTEKSGIIARNFVVPGEGNLGTALKTLFGSAKIRALEYIQQSVHDPGETFGRLRELGYDLNDGATEGALYPENRMNAVGEMLKQLIISESLMYGVPSSFTAFIGVSEHTGIAPRVTVAIPNAMPAEWETSLCCMSAPVVSDESFQFEESEESICEAEMIYEMNSIPGVQQMVDRRHLAHGRMIPCIPEETPRFSNVKIARRAPKPQASVDITIPSIREVNGGAILFEDVRIKKGTHSFILTFKSGVNVGEVSIRFFLDGNEIGFWALDDHSSKSPNEFIVELLVSRTGTLKAVLSDPNGYLDGKALEIIIRPGV
ncbi:MAG: VIT and VWA domain-containing protein [Methanomicrobiales archaeon]|nr:VIT and VWA domain-containing protein [Methanomicrobiales archaeon]